MKKIAWIIIILIFTIPKVYSQTTEETVSWINSHSQNRHLVEYKNNKINLISKREIPGSSYWTESYTINPASISRIYYNYNESTGWGTIAIKFTKKTNQVVKIQISDKPNSENQNDTRTENRERTVELLTLKYNEEKIKSIMKAYLHLFKKFNPNIKEGDLF